MSHFARSTRWRRLFFAACLPYMLVSVLVESLHVSPTWRQEPVRAIQTLAANASQPSPASGPCMHAAGVDESSCPACNWLRVSRRVENGVTLVRTRDVAVEKLAAASATWPDSPTPHPSLLRGPPLPVRS